MMSKIVKFLALMLTLVVLTACGGSGSDNPTAQDTAIEKIMAYAQNGGTPPTLQDYLNAGVKGITKENLDEINEVVENLKEEDVDTREEIQALADELGIVLPDTSAPVMTIKGSNPTAIIQDNTYADAGATAIDDTDGDITANIVTTGTVDTSIVASYTVSYAVSDSAGNSAEANRTVNVTAAPTPSPTPEPDTTAPVFTSSDAASVYENQTDAIALVATDNESAVTYGISASDAGSFDVDVSTGVVTFITAADYETKDSYTFIATATDASGNETTQTVTITILDVTCEGAITHNGTDYCEVTSPYTNKVWLDRNLGAARVCEQFNDTACYGDYYQWGRNFDGHEESTSGTTTAQAVDVNSVGHGDFITSSSTYDHDWAKIADADGSLRVANWSSTNGNSVCPVGFKVPTLEELKAELVDDGSAEIQNREDAFDSFLKLPSAGKRYYFDGSMHNVGSWGNVWACSVVHYSAPVFAFDSSVAIWGSTSRPYGLSVRCLRD